MGGSGLGLSICKTIIEAHNGSIKAEPSSYGGLTIKIVLPGPFITTYSVDNMKEINQELN